METYALSFFIGLECAGTQLLVEFDYEPTIFLSCDFSRVAGKRIGGKFGIVAEGYCCSRQFAYGGARWQPVVGGFDDGDSVVVAGAWCAADLENGTRRCRFPYAACIGVVGVRAQLHPL